MPSPHTLEKLRKLASVGRQKADLNWLFYLSGEGEERQAADELLDIQLFQQIQKGYKEQIFLDPPAPERCYGLYQLGWVLYPPGKRYCSFGLREDEWIKHLLIVGMTGTGLSARESKPSPIRGKGRTAVAHPFRRGRRQPALLTALGREQKQSERFVG